ncbi:MAG: hypothetical protein MZV70_42530 [Desulfobacterales bacterium]|nr:hypothetical protein [Desulfobacterales bacterium]
MPGVPVATRMLRSLMAFSCSLILACRELMRSLISEGAHLNLSATEENKPGREPMIVPGERVPAMASILRRPADTLGFRDDLHRADLAGGCAVRAAAELHGYVIAHGHYPHLVAVFLGEERHGTLAHGLVLGEDLGLDGQVLQYELVYDSLNLFQLLVRSRQRSAVKSNLSLASVTREPDWCTCSPSTSLKRPLEQVGGAVVTHDALTPCMHLLQA